MKFIIDAQLPQRLSEYIKNKGFDSIHTLDLPSKNATTDSNICKISKDENRVVISKDSDFLNSYLVNQMPPKLILVKTGNIDNNSLIDIFALYLDKIVNELATNNLIEITNEEIIVHQ